MNKLRNQEDFIRAIVDEINFIRGYPQKYADKLNSLKSYIKGKIFKYPESVRILTQEGERAFDDAINFLENKAPIEKLQNCPGLYRIAEDSLTQIQRVQDVNQMNDYDMDSIIERYGQVVGSFAQAVDFGSPIPELVVANLFVDDGDQTRRNRDNLFNHKHKLIGIATGNHKTYNYATIILFARHFYERGVKPPGDLSDDNYASDPEVKKNEVKEDARARERLNVKDKNQKDNLNDMMNNMKNLTNIEKKYHKDADRGDSNKEKKEPQAAKKVEEKVPIFDEDDDFDLPEGVVKMDKKEKIVEENGVKKKIILLTKYMEDGSIEKQKIKVDVK